MNAKETLMRMRGSLKRLALALGLAVAATAAEAAVTDSLTITITPNASYSVVIDTSDVHMDLGVVDLGQSTATVFPATVTVQSSFAATDLKLRGVITGAGVPWTFAGNTAAQATDQLAAWAVFTDTSVASIPAQAGGYFSGTVPAASGSDVVDAAANRDVGVVSGINPLFVALPGEPGYKTMESLPPFAVDPAASRSHLWLRFRLPPGTTDTNPKLITITLTAGAPN